MTDQTNPFDAATPALIECYEANCRGGFVYRQHDSHVGARIDHLIRCIYEALGIVNCCDFTAWYACGDELI